MGGEDCTLAKAPITRTSPVSAAVTSAPRRTLLKPFLSFHRTFVGYRARVEWGPKSACSTWGRRGGSLGPGPPVAGASGDTEPVGARLVPKAHFRACVRGLLVGYAAVPLQPPPAPPPRKGLAKPNLKATLLLKCPVCIAPFGSYAIWEPPLRAGHKAANHSNWILENPRV